MAEQSLGENIATSFSSCLGPGCIFIQSSIHSTGRTQIVYSVKIKFQLISNTAQVQTLATETVPRTESCKRSFLFICQLWTAPSVVTTIVSILPSFKKGGFY